MRASRALPSGRAVSLTVEQIDGVYMLIATPHDTRQRVPICSAELMEFKKISELVGEEDIPFGLVRMLTASSSSVSFSSSRPVIPPKHSSSSSSSASLYVNPPKSGSSSSSSSSSKKRGSTAAGSALSMVDESDVESKDKRHKASAVVRPYDWVESEFVEACRVFDAITTDKNLYDLERPGKTKARSEARENFTKTLCGMYGEYMKEILTTKSRPTDRYPRGQKLMLEHPAVFLHLFIMKWENGHVYHMSVNLPLDLQQKAVKQYYSHPLDGEPESYGDLFSAMAVGCDDIRWNTYFRFLNDRDVKERYRVGGILNEYLSLCGAPDRFRESPDDNEDEYGNKISYDGEDEDDEEDEDEEYDDDGGSFAH